MADYIYIDVVKLGIDAGHARVPRLQKSAVNEFGEMLSREVKAGQWTRDGDEALNAEGLTVEAYLDVLLSTRPHWAVPAVLVDAADETWLSGSLTKQGARWRELKAYLGSDKAADEAMAEEAARYGVTPGSTKKGIVPGSESDDKDNKQKAGGSNPWSDKWTLSEQAREEKIASIIRGLGTKAAASMAASAGTTIGRPLRKK